MLMNIALQELAEQADKFGLSRGKQKSTNTLEQTLEPRFKGSLEARPEYKKGIWKRGKVAGLNVWVDNKSGIVWLDHQGYLVPSLNSHKARNSITYCRELEPKEYWDLPTLSEFALGTEHNIQEVVNDIPSKEWMFQVENNSFSIDSVRLHEINFDAPPNDTVSVRCVGRTKTAPAQGYGLLDVSGKTREKLLKFMEAND